MIESVPSPEKDPVTAQIEIWKHSPTVLASASDFRKERLEDMGFTDVSVLPNIPESVETELAETLGSSAPDDKIINGSAFSKHIASAKVSHAIESGAVSDEALVIGFDTTAVVFTKPTEEQMMGVPQAAEKYEHIEAARAGILERFHILAAGIKHREQKLSEFRRVQEQIGGSKEEIAETLAFQSAGIRRGHIYVYTAAAAAFPNKHDQVPCFSEEVQLRAAAIAEAADNEQALEKLADLVIETQGEEKTLQISGGVDYADNYVRDILGLQEVRSFKTDVEDELLYRGFAPKALQILLRHEAENTQK